jgi:hypothetical protein
VRISFDTKGRRMASLSQPSVHAPIHARLVELKKVSSSI